MKKFLLLTILVFIIMSIMLSCGSSSKKNIATSKTKNPKMIKNESDIPEWVKNGGSIPGFFCGMGSKQVAGNNVSFAAKAARRRAFVDFESNLKTKVIEIFEDNYRQIESNRKLYDEEDIKRITKQLVFNDEQTSMDINYNWSDSEYVYVIFCINSQRAYDVFNKNKLDQN